MVGYNVLKMYLRTIGFFVGIQKVCGKKITLGHPHFIEEGSQKCAPSPLLFTFLTLP